MENEISIGQSRWERYAVQLIEARYPCPPHRLVRQQPRVRVGTTWLIADFAVHDTADHDRLVAAVEVGDLSSPTKLSALEAALPAVRIWWVPKADLLHLVAPEIGRYRLAWAEGGPDANGLLRQVVSARVATERLAQEVAKQALAARDGLRGVVSALRQQSDTSLQLVREQAIERTIRVLGRWDERQLAASDCRRCHCGRCPRGTWNGTR